MTTRTRYFIVGSLGVLVVGLCTGLIAYYSGLSTGAFAVAPEPAEIEYVPADASVLAFARVREVMDSQLRQRLRQSMPGPADGHREFEQRTGINIETDIDYVLATMLPGERSTTLVLARGWFDNTRLESLAREHGGVVEEYQGKQLILHTGGRPGEEAALAFLEPGLLAFGEASAIRRAIDTQRAGGNIRSNQELMGLLRDIEVTTSAWAIGRFDDGTLRSHLPEQVAGQIPPIRWFAASGHVNGGISGRIRAEARDVESAQNLRDLLQGFLALARIQGGGNPDYQSLLQSLQLEGSGTTVALSFAIPAEVMGVMIPQDPGRLR